MSAGITFGFLKWKFEKYVGVGKGRFTIAELSGTVLGVTIAAFVKIF